jgi:hypothetical protein
MAKARKSISSGLKAMKNEALSDAAKGKKQVLKLKGHAEKPSLPAKNQEQFNTGMPKAKKSGKKKKSSKSNVPHAY